MLQSSSGLRATVICYGQRKAHGFRSRGRFKLPTMAIVLWFNTWELGVPDVGVLVMRILLFRVLY